MIEEARDIICDTGPIIHLDELGCLDLLDDFKEILLTVSVVEVIEKHRPVALTVKLPFRVLRAHNPADERLAAMCRIFALDRGETESLIIMESRPAAIFLTDDASARMVAERMGFSSWNDRCHCPGDKTGAEKSGRGIVHNRQHSITKYFVHKINTFKGDCPPNQERVQHLKKVAVARNNRGISWRSIPSSLPKRLSGVFFATSLPPITSLTNACTRRCAAALAG